MPSSTQGGCLPLAKTKQVPSEGAECSVETAKVMCGRQPEMLCEA